MIRIKTCFAFSLFLLLNIRLDGISISTVCCISKTVKQMYKNKNAFYVSVAFSFDAEQIVKTLIPCYLMSYFTIKQPYSQG